MVGLARWCIRRRNVIIIAWVVALVGLGGLVGAVGNGFSDSTRLPASDSSTAYDLLAAAGSDAAKVTVGTIVWHTDTGSAVSAATRDEIAPMLREVAGVDGVKQVVSPFDRTGSTAVSKDGRTAYATVVFTDDQHHEQAADIAKHASSDGLSVKVGGAAFTHVAPGGLSEVIGVLAALLILLIVFRSVWAAALPIITGVAGVAVSSLGVMLLSHTMTLPEVAPSLGALIGLGVGIDYALFIVNRHRKALRRGVELQTSITAAMNTSGRAVLFAGGTVIIALLGMIILDVGFLTGLGISASLTVLLTVLAAVTLLPALLAKIGLRVLRRSDRRTIEARDVATLVVADQGRTGLWTRWAGVVRRRPVVAAVAGTAVLVALAAPALAIRLGSADASSDPTDSASRSFYDTMAPAFGAGFDASLLLVARTPDDRSRAAWTTLAESLPSADGVASVGRISEVDGNRLQTLQVVPTTTAQATATSDLVQSLRSGLVKQTERGTDLDVYIGGTTATNIDFAKALTDKLPLFLAIIAVLGFLLLMLAFRSLLVPLIGAIGNLLTIAIALGATVALFQWGWGPELFGIGGDAPLEYIVAILIVGVVFGLSMDYHVFLVSRMHEEWTETADNDRAVSAGVGDTGRVIVTAAVIMTCVFAAFGLAGVRTISEFGVGLAVAVLVDAFLLRMTVIPAVMHVVGRRNWALPRVLDKALPHVSIESPGRPATVPGAPSTDRTDTVDAP